MKTAISLFNFQRLVQKTVLVAIIILLLFINHKTTATGRSISSPATTIFPTAISFHQQPLPQHKDI